MIGYLAEEMEGLQERPRTVTSAHSALTGVKTEYTQIKSPQCFC
jgi:hypothetical protein